MANVRFTTDEMRASAAEFTTQAGELETIISTLTNSLQNLQETWEGEAAVACANQFEELTPGFNKAVQLIEDLAQQLTTTADAYDQNEEALKGMFGR